MFKYITMTEQRVLLDAFVLSVLTGLQIEAKAGEVETNITIEYVSEYVERNQTLSGPAVQPSVELVFGDLSVGGWSSRAVGGHKEASANPTELFVTYAHKVSDMIETSLGVKLVNEADLENIFDIGKDGASTIELSVSIAFDMEGAPVLSTYYDIYGDVFVVEAEVGTSWKVASDIQFELGLTLGLITGEGNADYQFSSLGVVLNYEVRDNTSVYIGATAGASTKNTFRDLGVDFATHALDSGKKANGWIGVGFSKTL